MKKIVFYIVVFSLSLVVYAQETLPLSVRLKNELNESSWVKETPFEKVEMTGVGHQISVFNVNPLQIAELMVAPKSGGLWFSDNGGETFRSIFENQPTNAIEALTVDWKNRTIAVGTPVGLFVSPDFGATWQFAGLASVKRISAIVMNPDNPKEIVVGALGDSFQPDEKRGVFKTTNGGESWQQKFFPGTQAGISQITVTKTQRCCMHPFGKTTNRPGKKNLTENKVLFIKAKTVAILGRKSHSITVLLRGIISGR